jgi:hypothetical protein
VEAAVAVAAVETGRLGTLEFAISAAKRTGWGEAQNSLVFEMAEGLEFEVGLEAVKLGF